MVLTSSSIEVIAEDTAVQLKSELQLESDRENPFFYRRSSVGVCAGVEGAGDPSPLEISRICRLGKCSQMDPSADGAAHLPTFCSVGRRDGMSADGTSHLLTSRLQIRQNVARWDDVRRWDGT